MEVSPRHPAGEPLLGLASNLFGEPLDPRPGGALARKYVMPPFSVLDGRSGAWRDRKRAWLALGIQSEVTRAGVSKGRQLGTTNGTTDAGFYAAKRAAERRVGRALGLQEFHEDYESSRPPTGRGASVFDPVLCELAYRWWCPPGGVVVDPFAGGSVRGIVAGRLGLRYWGCELRADQVAANREQAARIPLGAAPAWVCGDARTELSSAPRCDFVFTCPPYGDLERYSDDPRDLSAMGWAEFVRAYRDTIAASVGCMGHDRFACFVVGDFRTPDRGFYRDFVGLTVAAFRDAGAGLYNEAVWLLPIASASMRANKQFVSRRKLVKVHQNVLVFCKGDWRAASDACLGVA